jgi:undecaprenyl diphosphate synthase
MDDMKNRNVPGHIAIIMDGNGRWAQERHLGRTAGHREGIKRVKEIIKAAGQLGVKVITLFAFSTENWQRPKNEISMLMAALNRFLESEISELDKNDVRLIVIGRLQPLPGYIQSKLRKAQERTKDNQGLTLVLALNYGSRQEIVDAARRFGCAVARGAVRPDELDVNEFGNYFYTAGLPDPDLLIRTSGEMRLSNFLLWQLSYTELYFVKKYWPDFTKEDLKKAIRVYQKRERRFGAIKC